MPSQAVHKRQEKNKRKGASAVANTYKHLLKAVDEDEEVIFGRITKVNRRDQFNVTIYDPTKKHLMEVQANVPYRNIDRLRTNLGDYVVVVQEGRKFEIFLPLAEEDVRPRKHRIHESLQKFSTTGVDASADSCGIEFDYGNEEEAELKVEDDKKSKKEKLSKHVERAMRQEQDGDDDVNVDDI
jgi:hypothetical protein